MNTWEICGQRLQPGESKQLWLEPNVPDYRMPATLIYGMARRGKDGTTKGEKTVLITAAVHGDEYPGMAAAIRLAQQIDPERLHGRLIIVHCVNMSGFWASNRFVDEDGSNLNANYPGHSRGDAGARIAAFFVEHIFPQVDFIVDLHSGSLKEPLTPCLFFPVAGSEAVRRVSEAAARATDIPYLIASQATSGHFSYAATALGIPGLLLERGSCGACREEWIEAYLYDLYLLLNHLDMYALPERYRDREICTKQLYERSAYLSADRQGLWYPVVEENMAVRKGQILGSIQDFFGNTVAEYYAQGDGRVFYYAAGLPVKPGDDLVAYGLEAYKRQ